MNSVLVTGGAGFLGSRVVQVLCEASVFDVRILDVERAGSTVFLHTENGGVPWAVDPIRGGISDPIATYACKGVDTVIHCAAAVPLCKDVEEIKHTNIDGTANLLLTCIRSGVKHFIYISSSAVYGRVRGGRVTSDTKPEPFEPYGQSKWDAERFLTELPKKYADKIGISIIRPRTIMGPGRLGLFGRLFEWVHQGKPIPVFNNGQNVYQFVDVRDVVGAVKRVAFRRNWGGVYNVGTYNFCTMRETLQSLIDHAKSKSRIVNLPYNTTQTILGWGERIGVSPYAKYQTMMYGESFWFDTEMMWNQMGIYHNVSNQQMFCDAYDWYVNHRDEVLARKDGSVHRRVM